MGDTTQASFEIAWVRPGVTADVLGPQIDALLTAVNEAGMDTISWAPSGPSTTVTELVVGDLHTGHLVDLGAIDDHFPPKLVTPDVAWTAHTQPVAEWMGDLVVNVPDFDQFYSSCDSDGSPQFTADDVLGWIDDHESMMALRNTVRRRTGSHLWQPLRNPPEGAVTSGSYRFDDGQLVYTPAAEEG